MQEKAADQMAPEQPASPENENATIPSEAKAVAREKKEKKVKEVKEKGPKPAPKPMKEKSMSMGGDKALIGVTVGKHENFSEWYTQAIVKSEMIEYYDVSGCYILRPWSFQIWEAVQGFLESEFKKEKVQNCYFPMFVTKSHLETEKSHVEGFAAEVAWVTKSGESDLAEHIAIRPTSETIMYPAYQKWIRSHRDLPLKLNQWNAVVRWEFKQPTPFIRTREFLWQEGHTAHAEAEEAVDFAKKILESYRKAYEEILAVPVIPGQKSEFEKFAGGHTTYTVEGYMPVNGRGLQCATSHYLGTNFAKMFNIEYEDTARVRRHVHQCSWGFTTRSIGAMIMVHGDDKGLVLPPKVAPIQVVVVPIVKKDSDSDALNEACRKAAEELEADGVRVFNDDRELYNPGWKYNHWELKGVPLRLEVGPRDIEQGTCRLVQRFDGLKSDFQRADIVSHVKEALDKIQIDMLEKARKVMNENIVVVDKFDDVLTQLNSRKLLMTPWCHQEPCEEKVKKTTGELSAQLEEETGMGGAMKTLCLPFDQPKLKDNAVCFSCGAPAKIYALWGRSY